MKTKSIYTMAFAGLALFVFTACIDLTGPVAGESVPDGMGAARIRLGGDGARTVVPDIGGYFFTLDFTAPGKTERNEVLDGGTTLTVALEPAVWTLAVKGYTNSSKTTLKVTGSAVVSVTAGTESTFDVYLAGDFSSGGTGSLFYSFDLPSTVSRAWVGLYPLDVQKKITGTMTANAWEKDISSSSGGTASDTLTGLPEGAYLAVVNLYAGGSNDTAVWTRAVHIDNGSATSLTNGFTAADFAKGDPVVGTGETTLGAKLDAALGSPSGSYTIVLDGTETDLGSFTPKNLSVTGKNITVTIRGNGKTVQLGSNGSLFTIGAASGSSLKLGLQDITLRGRSGNNGSLAGMNSRGTLEMKAGSLITGNTYTDGSGGGVLVSGGTFIMGGGAVSGNSASGGGVFINSGTFNMSGGAVSGNSASFDGGGVFVLGGTFSMSGGTVSSNSGGGVAVGNGTFIMSGGAVSGNSASGTGSRGGGVLVAGGTFIMGGGAVSGNSGGGGVFINSGTFNMSGGAVSGNSASGMGGGVFVGNGTFSMSGGAVSGNILSGANSFGREVFPVGGTFIISGGARPERVFLMMGQVIFISGPLSSGTVIDLEVTSGAPLTSWVNQQILQLYPSYSSGNLASLKNYFTLGNAKQTDSPYTETAIPANYTIGNDGRMRN